MVYVDIDAHNRNRSIFETLLPRASTSKEFDAALLYFGQSALMGPIDKETEKEEDWHHSDQE